MYWTIFDLKVVVVLEERYVNKICIRESKMCILFWENLNRVCGKGVKIYM